MPSDFTSIPDDLLLASVRRGDAGAFDALVRRYFGLVYTIAFARLGDRDTAEDLAQEVFLRVHLAMGTLTSSEHFGAWLRTVARNLATDWRRRGGGRVERLLDKAPLDSLSSADEMKTAVPPEAPSRLEAEDTTRLLGQALDRLNPALREIVLLHYMEDLSKSDIARQLGVHPSTVSRQLDAALRRLRRYVDASLQGAAKGLRPRPKAVARTVLLPGAVAALSVTQKSALAKAAVAALPAAAKGLAAGQGGGLLSGPIRFLHHLKALSATGGLPMGGVKGIAIATAGVAVVTAGVCFYAAESSGKGGPPSTPAVSRISASAVALSPAAGVPKPVVQQVRNGGAYVAPPAAVSGAAPSVSTVPSVAEAAAPKGPPLETADPSAPGANVSANLPQGAAQAVAASAAATPSPETDKPRAYLDFRFVSDRPGRPFGIMEGWTVRTKPPVSGIHFMGGASFTAGGVAAPMLMSLGSRQIPFDQAIKELSEKTKYRIEVRADTAGKTVDLLAYRSNLYEVLDRLCQSAGLVWWTGGRQHVIIANAAPYKDWLQTKLKQAVEALAAKYDFHAAQVAEQGFRLTPKPGILPVRGGPLLDPEIYGKQVKPSNPATDPKVTLSITQGTVGDLAKALSAQLGKPVRIVGPADDLRFDVSARNEPLCTALDTASKAGGPFRWWADGRGRLYIGYNDYCPSTHIIPDQENIEKGLDLVAQSHNAYWTKQASGSQVSYDIYVRGSTPAPPLPTPVLPDLRSIRNRMNQHQSSGAAAPGSNVP